MSLSKLEYALIDEFRVVWFGIFESLKLAALAFKANQSTATQNDLVYWGLMLAEVEADWMLFGAWYDMYIRTDVARELHSLRDVSVRLRESRNSGNPKLQRTAVRALCQAAVRLK